MSWATWIFVKPSAQSFLARSHNSGRNRRGRFGDLRSCFGSRASKNCGHRLIADTGLTERANLLDIFLTELGRLTSASLADGASVLARHGRFHGAASISA